MNTGTLLNFLNSLEQQGVLSLSVNQRIQRFLDYNVKSTGKLFLTITAIAGALFASAGVFAIISHNWDDFPKHVRGVLSFFPSLIALFIYYLAIFKHGKSTSWIEASSLFLMLMIGASIALVSQTYQMDGDFDKFILVWLVLTIPLFYFANASGIAVFYLLLACNFLTPSFSWGFLAPSDYALNDRYYMFWFFLLAFLPHFYRNLNKSESRQSFRAIYLGMVLTVVFFFSLPLSVKAGYLWWGVATLMGYYLIGKRYFAHNISHLGRPFQTFTLFGVFISMLYFTNEWFYKLAFKMDRIKEIGSWNAEQIAFYIIGVAAVVALTIYAIKLKKIKAPLNRYIIFIPFLFVLLYAIFCLNEFFNFDIEWFGFLVLNLYILGFGMNAMIQGNKSKNILYMIYGLILVICLLWMRYFDLDLSFWLKGLLFIGVGLMFGLIHFLSADEFEPEA